MSIKARPQDYAAAIYDLAFEAWTRQLGSVQEALKRDASLRLNLDDPQDSIRNRLQLLENAVPGGLDDSVLRFLGTLLEAGQLDLLDAILAEFQQLVRRRPERKLARVTSAVSFSSLK